MDEAPEDPFGKLAEAATTVHEFYDSLVESGFLELQALYLTGKFVETLFQPRLE